jgi:tape measure domain-containing protein
MSNMLQYIIQLKDQMTTGLNRIGQNANSMFGSIDRRAGRTTKSVNDLNAQIDALTTTRNLSINTTQIRNASREIARLEAQRDRLTGNGASGKGGGGLMGLGGKLMANPYVATAIAVGTAVGSVGALSAKKESAITGLSTFIGKDNANEAYGNIQKDADVTPYGVNSLLGVNRALISAGLNAKDARQDTMNLANAISAVGGTDETLERMAANMQQIKTVGTATATDIKQFGIAGINIYEMLAQATGKSVAQVKDMDVSYDLLAYAMDKAAAKGGIYAGALVAQSETIGAKWNTMIDGLKGAGTDLGDFLKPGLKVMIQYITEFVDGYRNLFKNWGAIMDNAKSWLGEKWDALGRNILYRLQIAGIDILKWADGIGNGIANGISKGISWASGGLIDLGKAAENPIYDLQKKALTDTHNAQLAHDKNINNTRVDVFRFNMGFNKFDKPSDVGPGNADRKWNLNGPFGKSDDKDKDKTSKDKLAKGVDAITGGGTRNMYINLGKFQDSINIYAGNVKEGIDNAGEQLEDMLLRVLNSGGAMQN